MTEPTVHARKEARHGIEGQGRVEHEEESAAEPQGKTPGEEGEKGREVTPGSPATIPDSAREVLESDALAHIVTLNPDGSPRVTVAWVGLDGDEVVFGTLPQQRKLRNLRLDPRVAVSIQTRNVNQWGLTEYLVLHGRARVIEGGGPELLQRLA